MPKPIKRRELITRFKDIGLGRPGSWQRHAVMRKGDHTVPIQNPHHSDIDWSLTKRILQQAGISLKNGNGFEIL